jgi:hypothetical protein
MSDDIKLPLEADSIDAIPEAARPLYREVDGKFRLPVDGLPDVDGIRRAQHEANEQAKRYRLQLREFQALAPTPEELAEKLAAAKAPEGDVKQMLEALKRERDEARKQAAEEAARARDERVMGELKQSLVTAGASPEALSLLPSALRSQIGYNEDGTLRIVDQSGQVLTGSGPEGRATLSELVAATVKQYPSLFAAKAAPGIGRKGAAGRSGGLSRASMTVAEKAAYAAEHGPEAYLNLPK